VARRLLVVVQASSLLYAGVRPSRAGCLHHNSSQVFPETGSLLRLAQRFEGGGQRLDAVPAGGQVYQFAFPDGLRKQRIHHTESLVLCLEALSIAGFS